MLTSILFSAIAIPSVLGIVIDSYNGLNFPFPFNTASPLKFDINVDHAFVEQTIQKVNLYRPTTAIQQSPDWEDGPPTRYLEELAQSWGENYDWFEVQQQLNKNFSHYATTVAGTRNYTHPIYFHFIHERSESDNAIPLLLLHGWPSTSLEWSKVVQPLAHPHDTSSSSTSFHVVAPDLPGFGFSPAPGYPGLGPRELGDAFDALMHQLGYPRYAVHSTDLGWFVGSWMAGDHASDLIAHSSDFWFPAPNATDLERYAHNETTAEETTAIKVYEAYTTEDFGYASIQSTRPLQIALAMTDSPVGWAGWVWELYDELSDGFPYTLGEVINDAFLLWIQGTYGNQRTYKEFFKPDLFPAFPNTSVPTGVLQWLNPRGRYADLDAFGTVPRDWIERYSNVTFFRRHEFGGHFPAYTVTEYWLKDVRDFFSAYV